jgi:hypothetical protein
MRFDLVDLRLFVAIVEAGSISKGAHAAHLALDFSYPKISRSASRPNCRHSESRPRFLKAAVRSGGRIACAGTSAIGWKAYWPLMAMIRRTQLASE